MTHKNADGILGMTEAEIGLIEYFADVTGATTGNVRKKKVALQQRQPSFVPYSWVFPHLETEKGKDIPQGQMD